MGIDLRVGPGRLSGVDLVIFDKDGTLIDVHAYWANMVKFRCERVGERLGLGADLRRGLMEAMGVDVEGWRIKPEGPVGIKKREIVLAAGADYLEGLGLGDRTDLFVEVFREVDQESLDHFSEIVRPLPGLYELLGALEDRGALIAVATTDRTDRARLAFRHLDLEDRIDCIAGADRVARTKPAPDLVDLICAELGVPAGRAVMVGDAVVDVQTGLRAGCLASVAVTSGMTPRSFFVGLTPHIVAGLSDLAVEASGPPV